MQTDRLNHQFTKYADLTFRGVKYEGLISERTLLAWQRDLVERNAGKDIDALNLAVIDGMAHRHHVVQKDPLTSILARAENQSIAVVGAPSIDLCEDGVGKGMAAEQAAFKGVLRGEEMFPGGASNTAMNLRTSAGCAVYPVGFIGTDSASESLTSMFSDRGVSLDGLILGNGSRGTWVYRKTSLTAQRSHGRSNMVLELNIPNGQNGNISPEQESLILEKVGWLIKERGVRVVVVSDYGKGDLTRGVYEGLNEIKGGSAPGGEEVTFVGDPRKNFGRHSGFDYVVPNDIELWEDFWGRDYDGETDLVPRDEVRRIGKKVLRKYRLSEMIVTMGKDGCMVFGSAREPHHLPVRSSGPKKDITGAGDSFAGAFAGAMGAGATVLQAADIGNYAGGINVIEHGTYAVPKRKIVSRRCKDLVF